MCRNVFRSSVSAVYVVVCLCMMLATGVAAQEQPVPPTVAADSYFTPPATALSVAGMGVLTNDFDPNNVGLSASLDLAPAHGTLSLSSNGSFTYTPETGFVGTDTFTYRAHSGSLSSPSQTASIVVGSPSHLNDCVAISCGEKHTLALSSDGIVWAWGSNSDGQLGNGTPNELGQGIPVGSASPSRVVGISDVVAVSAGHTHSLALGRDGRVWAWGYNHEGCIGDGTTVSKAKPVQVLNLAGVVAICAGQGTSMALKSDGTVWAWGDNSYGQLGNGTTTRSLVPVKVSGLSDVTALSAGQEHSVALKSNGTVWTWGNNTAGQLGIGRGASSSLPVQVIGLSNVKAIGAGCFYTVALTQSGTVMAWGATGGSLLGPGVFGDFGLPATVAGLPSVTKIAVGYGHIMAVTGGGALWTWGANSDGELGRNLLMSADGFLIDYSDTPTQVAGVADVADMSAGDRFSVVLKSDGTLWGFGNNLYGQLGYGLSQGNHLAPVQAHLSGAATKISASLSYTTVLKSDGSVWSFGTGTLAQLGDRRSEGESSIPVQAIGLTGITAISDGQDHVVALKNDGTAWVWGYNGTGQFGNGAGVYGGVPAQGPSFTDVIGIGAGGGHSLFIRSDHSLWTCGYNWSGQLGNGSSRTSSATPVQVLTDVIAASGGTAHSVAIKSDGTVWCWGSNHYGEQGNGTSGADVTTPAQTPGISGVTAVAAGGYLTVALKNDGTVWDWGINYQNQLGRGGLPNVPGQVPGLTNVTAIAAGFGHGVALKSDGTVWTWGENNSGQLGDGTYTGRGAPVQVPGLSDAVAIGAGWHHTVVVKSDGTVWGWGAGWEGELGDGRLLRSSVPIPADPLPVPADSTRPAKPVVIDSGETTVVTDTLSASWSSSDGQSGIASYEYAVGTTPSDPGRGYVLGWKAAGTATGVTLDRLSLIPGKTYYWYVRATNGYGLWSDVGVSDGLHILTARSLPNQSTITMKGMIVTSAVSPGSFYVEAASRVWGIRVVKADYIPSAGKVDVTGVVKTSESGERYVDATSVVEMGAGSVDPLFVTSRALGGGDWNYNPGTGAGQRGVKSGSGLNNVGLLVKMAGKVTGVGGDFFYIDDGAAIKDGSGYVGVRVICPGMSKPESGAVTVVGVSSIVKIGDDSCRCVLPRTRADIVP